MAQRRSTSKPATPRRRARRTDAASRTAAEPNEIAAVPVVEERLHVGKKRKTAGVRIRVVPQQHTETVDLALLQEEVEVHRVPINRVVDAPASVRQEGNVLIVPVFEEVITIEKKLVLREEVHIRRRRRTRREIQTVPVRREIVEITRPNHSS